MNTFSCNKIGEICSAEDGFAITISPEYKEGLTGLEGFSWVSIVWWAHQLDGPEYRKMVTTNKPYKKGPDTLGLFATRSPIRPNPIAVTPIYVLKIDMEAGVIYTPYIDAEVGTPVLDIKPYHGCTDVVSTISVPEWCAGWPKSIEESAHFNWDEVFNF